MVRAQHGAYGEGFPTPTTITHRRADSSNMRTVGLQALQTSGGERSQRIGE